MSRQSFVLLLMLFVFTGCSDAPTDAPSSAPSESAGSQQEQSESTVAEGKSESSSSVPTRVDYDADPIVMTPVQWAGHRKDLKYKTVHLKGRTVRLTGEVSDIGVDLGYYDKKKPTTALMFHLPKDENTVNDLACEFTGPPVWKSVGPGQKVTLEFKYSSEYSARPTDCKIVSVEGDSFPVIEAGELALAFVKDKAALDKKYISKPAASEPASEPNGERKSLGLAGKVKEVKRFDSGSVTIRFETDKNIYVEANMYSLIAEKAELPVAGDYYRVWGTYQSEASRGFLKGSVGVSNAAPFPVK